MPKISQNKGGGIIVWDKDDWKGGLHPQYSSSAQVARRDGNYLAAAQSIDPYRNVGVLTPGYNPTDSTNVSIVDAVQVNLFTYGAFAYTVGGGSLNRVVSIDASITNDTAGTGFPHVINHSHTNEIGVDICSYVAKVGGVSSLRGFYSFYDDTDWDVGTFDFATPSAFDDDFMSTAPATPLASPYLAGGKSYPHPLIVGDDDILYIGDRNFVHGYDGQNVADNDGKFFPAVLTIPNGYIITGFARINPTSLVVFAYKDNTAGVFSLGQATAFFWDYLSLDPYKIVDLNDNYVSAPFEYKSTVGCFTLGRPTDRSNTNKNGKLQIWDGNQFQIVGTYIDDADGISHAVARGGVDILGDMIQYLSNGQIYSYGNNLGLPYVLNKVTKTTGTGGGLLKSINQIYQLASSGITTTGGMQYFDSKYEDESIFSGVVGEPEFPVGQLGRAKKIRIFFSAVCSEGRTVDVVFKVSDKNVAYTILSGIGTLESGKLCYERELDVGGAPLPEFVGIFPIINWNAGAGPNDAPAIDKIEVEYEFKNIIYV